MSDRNSEIYPEATDFSGCSVVVVGDLILDRYIWGRASRISQEAPVPIVRVEKETFAPGGAANVVRNILSLGGVAAACGAVGSDPHGVQLTDHLLELGADVTGIISLDKRCTTVKTRILAGGQQVVRVDRELTEPIGPKASAGIRESLLSLIDSGDIHAVVLEDYAKGVLSDGLVQEILDLGKRSGVMVALDPHPGHFFDIRGGLNLMTPNRAEAFALAGEYFRPGGVCLDKDRPMLEVGRKLQHEWEVDVLLVTLGRDGMALFLPGEEPVHIPTRARDVFDVSGAGDTVMAAFVLALVKGASPSTAAMIANIAAGVVVGKVGTASVTLPELRRVLTGFAVEKE